MVKLVRSCPGSDIIMHMNGWYSVASSLTAAVAIRHAAMFVLLWRPSGCVFLFPANNVLVAL